MQVFSNIINIQPSVYVDELLRKSGQITQYKKRELITVPDKIPEGSYYILKGRVFAKQYTPYGEEMVWFVVGEGALLLSTNTLFDFPPSYFLKTFEDTEVLFIPKDTLVNLIDSDKYVSMYVIETVSVILYSFMKQLSEKYNYTVPWRMSNFLLDLAENFGEKAGTKTKLNLRLSQQFLSAALSINRVTTAKNLKELKSRGLLDFFNDYYYIVDILAMRRYRDENSL